MSWRAYFMSWRELESIFYELESIFYELESIFFELESIFYPGGTALADNNAVKKLGRDLGKTTTK